METFSFAPSGQLEIFKDSVESKMKLFDNCVAMSCVALNNALDAFWQGEDQDILELLNEQGLAKSQAMFADHQKRANQLNAMRAQRNLPPLAKVGAPRAVTVNPQTGKFELVPPPEIEQSPEA